MDENKKNSPNGWTNEELNGRIKITRQTEGRMEN